MHIDCWNGDTEDLDTLAIEAKYSGIWITTTIGDNTIELCYQHNDETDKMDIVKVERDSNGKWISNTVIHSIG